MYEIRITLLNPDNYIEHGNGALLYLINNYRNNGNENHWLSIPSNVTISKLWYWHRGEAGANPGNPHLWNNIQYGSCMVAGVFYKINLL